MSTAAERVTERATLIAETVAQIRAIERELGITPYALHQIKLQLLALAARTTLFPLEDFPPPQPEEPRNSCLYRVSEDPDHRFALYLNAAHACWDTPAHNHTTWAVIVGIHGAELNKFYRRSEQGGVKQIGQDVVTTGTGVAFMPDDLHSIHISGEQPLLNFHMYGLALEQLHERQYYSEQDNGWHTFPAHSDIREARGESSELRVSGVRS